MFFLNIYQSIEKISSIYCHVLGSYARFSTAHSVSDRHCYINLGQLIRLRQSSAIHPVSSDFIKKVGSCSPNADIHTIVFVKFLGDLNSQVSSSQRDSNLNSRGRVLTGLLEQIKGLFRLDASVPI